MGKYIKMWYNGKLITVYKPSGVITSDKSPRAFFRRQYLHCSSKMDNFCVRCGCNVGDKWVEKTLSDYKGIMLCDYCIDQKEKGYRNTPDIEDLSTDELSELANLSILASKTRLDR